MGEFALKSCFRDPGKVTEMRLASHENCVQFRAYGISKCMICCARCRHLHTYLTEMRCISSFWEVGVSNWELQGDDFDFFVFSRTHITYYRSKS